MNKPNFTGLAKALKRGSSKIVGFKHVKPRNFDGVRDQKVVDAWLVEMEDYFHVAKVGQHFTMELVRSYIKGYASTWWRMVRQEERKTHGYTWEFFKEHNLVNVTNDNLHQNVRAYTKFMFDIQHMHELDWVCRFVMEFPTWAKCKFEENWATSLFEAIMKMEGFLKCGMG